MSLSKLWERGKDREAWHAAVLGVVVEFDMVQQLDTTTRKGTTGPNMFPDRSGQGHLCNGLAKMKKKESASKSKGQFTESTGNKETR